MSDTTTITPTPTRKPRRSLKFRIGVAAAGAVGSIALISAIASAGQHPAAPAAKAVPTHSAPAPARHTAPAKPAHHAAAPAPVASIPAAPAVSAYAQRILGAGITAPASWIDSTGHTLVADWQAGDTQAWTDQNVLTAGGVLPAHLAVFDQITESYFGVQPPAAPAAPAAQAPDSSTASQQQALTQAQGYLSDGQGFSRQGLIDQLDSQYGGQFSVADATWAVDNSGANWYQQAAIAAKGYASDGQGFSRQGLIDQLTSAYGGQFTYDQAVYGVNQAGL